MKIDLLSGSYKQRYNESNSTRTINWYSVFASQQEKQNTPNPLFPSPGLTLFANIPGRYNRGFVVVTLSGSKRCFTVIDTTLYEVFKNGSYSNLGTLSNLAVGASTVRLVANKNQLGIFHTSASYYLTFSTNVLAQITTIQFVGSVDYANYMDGYTFVVSGGAVYYSQNNDISIWNSLFTFTPSYTTAPIKALEILKEYIYCFADDRVEIFQNDGQTPFSRVSRTTSDIGIVATNSTVKFHNGIVFLGRSPKGEAAVYMVDTFLIPRPLTPLSNAYQINKLPLAKLSNSYAFFQYNKEGHETYVLTIPILNQTFVYDFITQDWSERSSRTPYNDSDGLVHNYEFRGRYFVDFDGLNLYSDLYSGKIYLEDYSNFTEDGQPIIRTHISQNYFDQNNAFISVYNLQIDINSGNATLSGQGSKPLLMLSVSNDKGYNYKQPNNISCGTLSQHSYRVKKGKLGTARNWIIKLQVSDPIDCMLNQAFVDGTVGSKPA